MENGDGYINYKGFVKMMMTKQNCDFFKNTQKYNFTQNSNLFWNKMIKVYLKKKFKIFVRRQVILINKYMESIF